MRLLDMKICCLRDHHKNTAYCDSNTRLVNRVWNRGQRLATIKLELQEVQYSY